MMNQDKKCIIFCGGNVSDYDFLKKHIADDDYIICADGGYKHCRALNMVPEIIIGDLDSIEDAKLQYKSELIKLNPEKDDTDALSAVKLAIEKGFKKIYIFGSLGGRLDHEIGNITLLNYSLKQGVRTFLIDKANCAFLIEDETITIGKSDDYYLSVFSLFCSTSVVTLKGVKYPLDNYLLDNIIPLGVSNEIISEKCEITVNNGNIIIILAEK